MYTGEMIENLIEKVQCAEATSIVRVTQARRRASADITFNTFIYEFGRAQNLSGPGTIGVA